MAQQSHYRKESMKKIRIGNRWIGDGEQVYTIAEAGANHDSELKKALKLIDAAIEAKQQEVVCFKKKARYELRQAKADLNVLLRVKQLLYGSGGADHTVTSTIAADTELHTDVVRGADECL